MSEVPDTTEAAPSPPKRSPFDHDGAYLDPAWLFSEGISLSQDDQVLVEVLQEFAAENGMSVAVETMVAGRQLLVTHGSGLFVQATSVIGREGYGVAERDRDRRDAARICNLLVCELGLEGVVARPLTPDDMCGALREGERASIWVAGGIKQVRSWATQAVLEGGEGGFDLPLAGRRCSRTPEIAGMLARLASRGRG